MVSERAADRLHFGTALYAGRIGTANAEPLLDALLTPLATPASEAAISAALADPSPLVRAAVPRALPPAPTSAMVQAVAPLLGDPVRAVRVETARVLAGVDQWAMATEQQTAFAAAYLELFDAEMIDADRPEAHLNLGLLEIKLRRPSEAENQYQTALRLDPNFTPALVNLADLDRMRGQNQEGTELLRKAMSIDPDSNGSSQPLARALSSSSMCAPALLVARSPNTGGCGERAVTVSLDRTRANSP